MIMKKFVGKKINPGFYKKIYKWSTKSQIFIEDSYIKKWTVYNNRKTISN